MTGKVCMGSRMIGISRLRLLSRVMHMSFGIPLISAEHEPHLPALQFQRSARSGACCAWMRCTASRTTMPSSTGVMKSWKAPPAESPRQIRNIACVAIDCPLFHLLNHRLQLIGHRRESPLLHQHFAIRPALNGDVVLAPFAVLVGKVFAKLCTGAFLAQ